MRRIHSTIAVALALVALLAGDVAAQSVSDIVEQMYASYERQAEGIDNYTLVQTVMGFESTSYFEKEMVDGRPIFRLRTGDVSGFNIGIGGDDSGMGDIYEMGPELIEHARYAGRETIDGTSVHVLAIDDLSQIEAVQQSAPDDMEFRARNGAIYVDADRLIPRRLQFVGDASTPSGPSEVTVSIDMLDVRDVEGLLVPFRTAMEISGLSAMIDPETQAQLEQMEEQLAALPPDQREMMERMMGAQLEQLRQMMAGGGDAMSMEVVVNDVRINSGPPSE